MNINRNLLLASLIVLPVIGIGPTAAQDVSQGQGMAVMHCARCHSIEKTGNSPVAEAPPFRTFSSKWPIDSLEEALAEGIVVGHPMMPQFKFEPPEIANLLAYIESVQP